MLTGRIWWVSNVNSASNNAAAPTRRLDCILPETHHINHLVETAEILVSGKREETITRIKQPSRLSGPTCRIRTYDPLLPKQMRYQTALRSDHVVRRVGLEPTTKGL